jgi:hypothetical protein
VVKKTDPIEQALDRLAVLRTESDAAAVAAELRKSRLSSVVGVQQQN